MKPLFSILSIAAMTCSTPALAAQFSSVIKAMAIPESARHNANGWDSIDDIEGVIWEWPYYESGAHDSTMVGHTKVGNSKNPNIGDTSLYVNGARSFITDIKISIQNLGEDPSEAALKNLFGQGESTKIPSSCDQSYATEAEATYQFKKSKYRPVFIRYSSSWGGSGGGSVDIIVANSLIRLNDGYDDCYDQQTLEAWEYYY